MESYGIFARTPVKGYFAPTWISLLQFPIQSLSLLMTITHSIDVYYYLFDGEQVSHQNELAQIAERSLSMREALGSIPRFSRYYRSSNSVFTMSSVWK